MQRTVISFDKTAVMTEWTVGMNEACMNLLGKENGIASSEGRKFALKTLDFMRDVLEDYQIETKA